MFYVKTAIEYSMDFRASHTARKGIASNGRRGKRQKIWQKAWRKFNAKQFFFFFFLFFRLSAREKRHLIEIFTTKNQLTKKVCNKSWHGGREWEEFSVTEASQESSSVELIPCSSFFFSTPNELNMLFEQKLLISAFISRQCLSLSLSLYCCYNGKSFSQFSSAFPSIHLTLRKCVNIFLLLKV